MLAVRGCSAVPSRLIRRLSYAWDRPVLRLLLQTPTWGSSTGVGEYRKLRNTFDDEMPAAASVITELSVHTATHIDAPSHFVKEYFDKGLGVESLDLGVLNGEQLTKWLQQIATAAATPLIGA